jgi:endonuclease/exonuclease/phosphatase family metal-dependent hydrolase
MPEADIGGRPPQDVVEDLKALSEALDASPIPPKTLDRNLLIATWNIRHFGGVTEKWTTDPEDSPRRNLRDVLCIAEIVSRFDVVALQEVKRDLRGLRLLIRALGPDWAFILTDVTKGREGNQERMAFLFDLRRIRPSGLAAELVVAIEEETIATEDTMRKQFARTPYAVSFLSQGATFTLVTLHVLYGKNPGDRLPEIRGIARWLAEWATEGDEFGDNLIGLGDFNIDRQGDPLYEAFVATGLRPAPELAGLPRTIYDQPQAHHHYDQVAWFTGEVGAPGLKPPLRYESRGGNFDFRPVLQRSLSNVALSWKISDHFPLWVSFSVRPTSNQ